MDACAELCSLAERLAGQAASPRRFLIDLGWAAAGIRPGPLWFLDAAVGGGNVLSGIGFAPEFDDDTRGQARHFAGTVAVAARIGGGATRWLSIHVGRDRADSADGRLTERAIEFAGLVASRKLELPATSGWIRRNLCAPSPVDLL